MTSAVMQQLVARTQAIRDERAADEAKIWKTLKHELAAGKMPTPEDVLQRLEACGKTPEELQETLELIERRRQWVATRETALKAEATVAECDELMLQAQERIDEFNRRHQAEVEPIIARRQIAERQARERIDAEKRLRETATDPEMLATLKQIDDLTRELGRDSRELDGSMRDLRETLGTNLATLDRAIADRAEESTIGRLRSKVSEQEQRLDEWSERQEKLRQKIEELNQQRKSVLERQLDPLAV